MHEFDAANRDRCGCEAFQAKHGTKPGLDAAMIPLDQIVEVLRLIKFRHLGKPALL